ncbi:MAG: CDP-alcohol phosphatidyltransferase family protein [Candidatus Neomarinimicrobiota bacterium]
MAEPQKKVKITDPSRIYTLANGISVLRAFLAFPLIYTLTRPDLLWATLLLIIISVLSDALDGYFARRANEVTHFGKLLDPLADSVVIIAVTFFLVLDPGRNFPLWYLLLFILRYLSIALFALYLMNHTSHQFGANKIGKVSVNFAALTIALYIFNYPVLDWLRLASMSCSVLLLVLSWVMYLYEYIKVLKRN